MPQQMDVVRDPAGLGIRYRSLDDQPNATSHTTRLIPTTKEQPQVLGYVFMFSSLFFLTCWLLLPEPLYLYQLPRPRKAHFSGLLGSQLFVFSGRGAHQSILDDLWSYDFYTKRWTQHVPDVEAYTRSDTIDATYGMTQREKLRRPGDRDTYINTPKAGLGGGLKSSGASEVVSKTVLLQEGNKRQSREESVDFKTDLVQDLQTLSIEEDTRNTATDLVSHNANLAAHTMNLAEDSTNLAEDDSTSAGIGNNFDPNTVVNPFNTDDTVHLSPALREHNYQHSMPGPFPSGKFNGCHVSTRDGIFVYGGDEEFYGLGDPNPDYMNHELWLLKVDTKQSTPSWERIGPIEWNYRGIEEEVGFDVSKFAHFVDGGPVVEGVNLEEPDLQSTHEYDAQGAITSLKAQDDLSNPQISLQEALFDKESSRTLKAQEHLLDLATQLSGKKLTPKNPHYFSYEMGRSAPACSYQFQFMIRAAEGSKIMSIEQ